MDDIKQKTFLVNKPIKCIWPEGGEQRVDVAIVGDAPNADAVLQGKPIAGAAWGLLREWLRAANINPANCLITNLFSYKPPGDDISRNFIRKLVAKRIAKKTGDFTSLHPMHPEWGWLDKVYEEDLERLRAELSIAKPNVVIVLGGTALWAFTGDPKIGKARGTTAYANDFFNNVKIVPTFHPSTIIKNYGNQPLAVMDIIKAKQESTTCEINRIERELWIEPTLGDVVTFYTKYIKNCEEPIAFDIETSEYGITCIGLAPAKERALVVPFYNQDTKDGSYWTATEELFVWQLLSRILGDDKYIKVGQNAMYDIMWLSLKAGIEVRGKYEDTMHMHHALQPEMPKGLAILGSLYTNEGSWKHMVSHSKKGNKRDD